MAKPGRDHDQSASKNENQAVGEAQQTSYGSLETLKAYVAIEPSATSLSNLLQTIQAHRTRARLDPKKQIIERTMPLLLIYDSCQLPGTREQRFNNVLRIKALFYVVVCGYSESAVSRKCCYCTIDMKVSDYPQTPVAIMFMIFS